MSDLRKKLMDTPIHKLRNEARKFGVERYSVMTKEELIKLVSTIAEGDITMQCPHGRPFVIELSRGDLDKWFKRKL